MPLERPAARAGAAAALALTAVLAAGGPASAEPPQDLAGEVTDTAGVLRDPAAVQAALDELADTTDLQLFVTYIDSFDGADPETWAAETAELSRLGVDDLLLVVAVEDRTYQVSVDPDLPLSDAELRDVEADRIEPRLGDDDWDGAAVAAAQGYADAVRPSAWPRVLGIAALVALLAAAVVAVVVVVRRRRRARAELDALEDAASAALVRTDDALAVWARELDYAAAELGDEQLGPFRAALPAARDRLTPAFAARAAADDLEDDGARRSALTGVVATCESIQATLTEQGAALAGLRDLHARAPQHLAELATRAEHVAAGARAAADHVALLRTRWAPSATAAVAEHPQQAAAAAAQATEVVAAGQARLDTDRAAAVAAVGEADALLDRGDALIAQVRGVAAELDAAPARVERAAASLTGDLADADRLGAADPGVAAAATRAREVLAAARPSLTGGDPLAALVALAQAEAALDAALAPHREQEQRVLRARQRLAEQLPRLQRELETAENIVRANRGVVGATARQRLAEAHAHAQTAGTQTDPLAGAAAVDLALAAVDAARRHARNDITAAARAAERAQAPSSGGWGGGLFSGGGSSWGASSSSSSRSRSRSSSSRRSSSTRSSTRSGSSRSRGSSSRGRRGGGGRF
ncbi:TPM domain-containing protein [Cellulomonas endometrii]|uniref:TPM domain-containing protein n=1 Tax=Cellulomonas endometrii TaxID=3036301 RepID=UPI0024AD5EB9|nr:TPM domain-containing protein [Cellulomonas endometrii]